jgi:ribosomal protein S21
MKQKYLKPKSYSDGSGGVIVLDSTAEGITKAIAALKQKLSREGFREALNRHAFARSPSERRKEKQRKAAKRRKREEKRREGKHEKRKNFKTVRTGEGKAFPKPGSHTANPTGRRLP